MFAVGTAKFVLLAAACTIASAGVLSVGTSEPAEAKMTCKNVGKRWQVCGEVKPGPSSSPASASASTSKDSRSAPGSLRPRDAAVPHAVGGTVRPAKSISRWADRAERCNYRHSRAGGNWLTVLRGIGGGSTVAWSNRFTSTSLRTCALGSRLRGDDVHGERCALSWVAHAAASTRLSRLQLPHGRLEVCAPLAIFLNHFGRRLGNEVLVG